MKYLLSSV
jgi:hypothetical protein